MNKILFLALAAPFIAGCAASGPTTAWGKEGVSMQDYRLDGAQCAVVGATTTPDANGANTAGGINGKNSSQPATPQVPTTQQSTGATGGAFPTGGGGMYRDSASPDFVQRAATQQRTQEMAAQKLRAEALKSCLAGRGYTEFSLTPPQRDKLNTLKAGTAERREYLYKLGTDPSVLKSQKVAKSGS
jgi:hypothetical protein